MKKKFIMLAAIMLGVSIGLVAVAAKSVQRGLAEGWLELGYSEDIAIRLGNTQMAAFLHSKIVNGHTPFNQNGYMRGAFAKYLGEQKKVLKLQLPQPDKPLSAFLTEWMPLYADAVKVGHFFPEKIEQKEPHEVIGFYDSIASHSFSKKWLNGPGKYAMATAIIRYFDHRKNNFRSWKERVEFINAFEEKLPIFEAVEEVKTAPFFATGKTPEAAYRQAAFLVVNNAWINQSAVNCDDGIVLDKFWTRYYEAVAKVRGQEKRYQQNIEKSAQVLSQSKKLIQEMCIAF